MLGNNLRYRLARPSTTTESKLITKKYVISCAQYIFSAILLRSTEQPDLNGNSSLIQVDRTSQCIYFTQIYMRVDKKKCFTKITLKYKSTTVLFIKHQFHSFKVLINYQFFIHMQTFILSVYRHDRRVPLKFSVFSLSFSGLW